MKNGQALLARWWEGFFSLLACRCCVVCGKALGPTEELLCFTCNKGLPRIESYRQQHVVEERFWGRIPIERAISYFWYRKGSLYDKLLFNLKYKNDKESGRILGNWIAAEYMSSGFFSGIDMLLPIPLHPKKMEKRGYNQSEWIAKGIADVTHIPVDTKSVIRLKDTDTQTHRSHAERWENVCNVFALLDGSSLCGKHVLLIDDVLTTGATLVSCANSILVVEGVRISVLTLAAAE